MPRISDYDERSTTLPLRRGRQGNQVTFAQSQASEGTPLVVQEALAQQPATLPQRRKRSPLSWLALGLVVIGCSAGAQWLLGYLWPTAPMMLRTMIPHLFALIDALAWDRAVALIAEARARKAPFPWQGLCRSAGLFILLFAFMIGMLLAMEWMLGLFSNSGFGLLVVVIVVFLGCMAGFMTLLLAPLEWVNRPLRRLDYTTALRRARQFERLLKSTSLKSVVLLYMGRYDEAEEAIRQSLQDAHTSLLLLDTVSGWLLENLGYALTEQGRYEEAIRAFEDAVAFAPTDSDRSSGLAEALLRAGRPPGQALAYAMHSSTHTHSKLIHRYTMRYSTGEVLGIYAWALASDGQRWNAEAMVAEAIKQADQRSQLSQVGLAYRAGQTLRVCRNEHKAREYFTWAAERDPQGHYGRCAQSALREA